MGGVVPAPSRAPTVARGHGAPRCVFMVSRVLGGWPGSWGSRQMFFPGGGSEGAPCPQPRGHWAESRRAVGVRTPGWPFHSDPGSPGGGPSSPLAHVHHVGGPWRGGGEGAPVRMCVTCPVLAPKVSLGKNRERNPKPLLSNPRPQPREQSSLWLHGSHTFFCFLEAHASGWLLALFRAFVQGLVLPPGRCPGRPVLPSEGWTVGSVASPLGPPPCSACWAH